MVRIKTGQQTGSRRTATAGVVKLRQPNATSCQRIEVGRFDFATEAAEITEAKIIDENAKNVRLLGSVSGKGNQKDSY